MNYGKPLSAALIAAAFTMAGGVQAQDVPSPQMLGQTCAACHGPNGSSVGITPSIAGMPAEYFVETMQAFRSGERKATVMDRIAKGYTDAELEAMGSYFAEQKVVPQRQAFSAEKARLGRTLHEDACEKCHEDGGRKGEDGGVLAGQSMLYLQYSMEDFAAGDRSMPKKMKKRVEKVMQEHGPEGAEALLHFYASQQ